LKGSPTIVAHTDKVGDIGGNCKMYEGQAPDTMVGDVLKISNIKEFLTVS
jgi:electron transfer flavoprotein beta subunit